MSDFEFFGIKLDFYIFSSLLVGYILWSIFLNDRHLRLKNKVNNLLDILGLSLLVFLSLALFPALTLAFVIFSTTTNISDLLNISKLLISIYSPIILLVILIIFRKERATRKRFHLIVGTLLLFQALCLTFLVGGLLATILTNYFSVFFEEFLPYIIIYAVAFIISILIVNKVFFDINSMIEKKIRYGAYIFLTIVLVLDIIFVHIALPQFKYNEPEISQHNINDISQNPYKINSIAKVKVDIEKFGLISPVTNRIPIQYGEFGFRENIDYDYLKAFVITEENFTFPLIDSFGSLKDNQFTNLNNRWFNAYLLRRDKGIIYLYFDEKNPINLSYISLEGPMIEQDSKKYKYVDYSICKANTCEISINVSNSYMESVKQISKTIINLNSEVKNISNCKFTKIDYQSNLNKSNHVNCNGKTCLLVLSTPDKHSQIYLGISDNNVVQLYALNFQEPINLSAKFTISCI